MRRAAVACALVAIGGVIAAPAAVSAQEGIFGGLQKSIDSTFTSVSTKTTDPSGTIRTDSVSFAPRLTLRVDSLVLPALRLNGGLVIEGDKMVTDVFSPNAQRTQLDSTLLKFRPFLLLRSTNQMFSPGVGFYRREERARTAGFAGTRLVNDEYAAYLGWQPTGGPQSDFQFIRTNTFDDHKRLLDTTKDFGSVVSNYSWRNLSGYYRGTFIDTTNRIRGFETVQTSNAGRVAYSQSLLARRLLLNGAYDINDQHLRSRTTGEGGEVEIPLSTNAGLSALSDTPVTAALSATPPLVDGNLTASVGIDLGLPAPGENAQARNIGVDLLNRTEINRAVLWVDRELPAEVASTFSFEIYSSTDNVLWTREAMVPTAPFGPFENRFQVDFPSFTARYVKVVVRPLSAVVPNASRYADIFVTELQPILRRSSTDLGRLGRTRHVVNADWRLLMLDRAGLSYEGFYLFDGPDTFGHRRRTLSNGVSLSHTFNQVVSVYGRSAYEQGQQTEGRRTAAISNATLTLTPLPTVRSSVLYAEQRERIAGLPNDRRGVYLQNTAQVRQGFDVQFGAGWSATERETGEIAHDRLLNLSTTITPRAHTSVTFSYDATLSRRAGTFVGAPRADTRRGYVAFAFDPLQTLHVVLGEELIVITGQKTRATHDVNVNWAPFPDGALQVLFAYNEARRDLLFGQERSLVGSVRWNLSRRSFLDVSYQRTRSEFVIQSTESRILSSDVRLYF